MLGVDLPEAAGSRLAERAGPAGAGARAGVGPGPVSGRDMEPGRRRRTAGGGPAEPGRRGLAQGLLGRKRRRKGRRWRSGSRAGVHRLAGDLGVVEVLLSLRLVQAAAAIGSGNHG